MSYTNLEAEVMTNESQSFKRPRLVTCMAFAAAILLITTCAIGVGLVMGYTYCYIEYRNAVKAGNITEATNFVHVVQLSQPDALSSRNKSINKALFSSVFISRILTIGEALMQQEENFLSWAGSNPTLD